MVRPGPGTGMPDEVGGQGAGDEHCHFTHCMPSWKPWLHTQVIVCWLAMAHMKSLHFLIEDDTEEQSVVLQKGS